jgi:hypothetical protein
VYSFDVPVVEADEMSETGRKIVSRLSNVADVSIWDF